MTARASRLRSAARLVGHHTNRLATGRLRRLPITAISDEFAFSFGASGWQPLRALLSEPPQPFEETAYARFFSAPTTQRVGTLNDLLFLHDPDRGRCLPQLWLGTYPWGGLTAGDCAGTPFGWAYDAATGADTAALWGRHRTPWYRPGDPSTMAIDVARTLELAASIEASGYAPWRARGWPRVCLLERAGGERRALVIDGHHRLGVLAHLGARRVRVDVDRVVRERDVERWPMVRDARCSADDARQIFHAFFDLDGRERFRAVTRSQMEVDQP